MLRRILTPILATGVLATAALAQDSVSKGGCLPGDAIRPWSTAATPGGSEQVNDYGVNLIPVFSSWSNTFAIAPIAKSSRSSSSFFNSLMGAQGFSRRFKRHTPFVAPSYGVVTAAGQGVNNDATINDPPATTVQSAGRLGNQFGVMFRENGSTDFAASYHGLVTGLVTIDPAESNRLYVRRIMAAVNGCDETADHATINPGGVDELGNCAFRSDGFSMMNGGCSVGILADTNLYMVDSASRNGAILNQVSTSFPGSFDGTTTKWVVRNQSVVGYNTPTLMPASLAGQSVLLGTNFSKQFVRGADFGLVTQDLSHLAGSVTDHRGNLAYTAKNFAAPISSTHGVAAVLGKVSTPTDQIDVFGLNSSANVTGKMALQLPAAITDNATGDVSLAGGQFDHYHSQVAFQGGNGQVGINVDPAGRLLVAAEVSTPYVSFNDTQNIIAVARVAPGGATSWTMAGYTTCVAGGGKPIVDAPFGNVLGTMVGMDVLTGTPGTGPSVSAPMIDAAGNVWFLSAIELFTPDPIGNPTTRTIGLLRAVYDPITFSYQLELVLKLHDQFVGGNSGVPFEITDLRLRDSDSVDSGTTWSGNISDEAYLGYPAAAFGYGDPRGTGGIVLQAQVRYDRDGNGSFEDCSAVPSTDEQYRVLMYVGANGDSGIQRYGQGCAGTGNITPILSWDGLPAANQTVTLSLRRGLGGAQSILVLGLTQAAIPLSGGCLLNIGVVLPTTITLPLAGAGAGNGQFTFSTPLPPTTPPGVTLTMQSFVIDPGFPRGYSNTAALKLTTQ